MSQLNLTKLFNNHLIEFLEDVIEIFPENVDLKTAFLKPKYGDASGVRGAARLGRKSISYKQR